MVGQWLHISASGLQGNLFVCDWLNSLEKPKVFTKKIKVSFLLKIIPGPALLTAATLYLASTPVGHKPPRRPVPPSPLYSVAAPAWPLWASECHSWYGYHWVQMAFRAGKISCDKTVLLEKHKTLAKTWKESGRTRFLKKSTRNVK